MTNEEQNWEEKIDWGRFDPPGGGRAFFESMKGIVPSLDAEIARLRGRFDAESGRMTDFEEIARLAGRLRREFTGLSESASFRRLVDFLDVHAEEIFGGEAATIGTWLRLGDCITRALAHGTPLAERWKADKARAERELATAENLRRFVKLYVSVCEADYKIRFAPLRLRTKMFRDVTRDVGALVAAGETLDRELAGEGSGGGFWDRAKEILDVARKTQKACRLARKSLERKGDRFWLEQEESWRSAARAR